MLTPLGQSEGVITVEDWAEIRRLHRSEGMAIKAIARRMGLARNTVRSALAADVLAANGYTRLSHLEGDMQAWVARGRPVEQRPAP